MSRFLWSQRESRSPIATQTENVAKELGRVLFEPVRLFGQGHWSRDMEGQWSLKRFKVHNFDSLEHDSLSTALTKLRAIGGEWGEDSYRELSEIRSTSNGSD